MNATLDPKSHPILHAASEGKLDKLADELSKLTVKQPAHNIKDASGRSALHIASGSGKWEIIKHLLEAEDLQFDLEAKDSEGTMIGWQ